MDSFFKQYGLKIWRWVLLAAGLAGVAAVAFVTLSRLAYPYELEWMEGGSLVQVYWILNQVPLYGPPSIDVIPYVYGPLYFYLSAALAAGMGLSFVPLRLVSLLSTLALGGCLFGLARGKSREVALPLVTVGLFFATFRLGGAWFDIARADMLFIALFFGGAWLTRAGGWRQQLLAALLFALAYWTKQTVLAAVFFLWGYLLLFNRKALLVQGLGLLVFAGLGTWLANALTGGWFVYYFFELPSRHGVAITRAEILRVFEILQPLLWTLPLVLIHFWLLYRRRAWQELGFIVCLLAGTFGLSWLALINPGSYDNVLIPAHAGWMLAVGLSLIEIQRLGVTWQQNGRTVYPQLALLGSVLLVFFQLWGLRYDVFQQLPGAADRRAGDQLVEMLRAIPDEVLIPSSEYLNLYAGKKPHAHVMAMHEVEGRFGEFDPQNPLSPQMDREVASRKYGAIILDCAPTFKVGIPEGYGEEKLFVKNDSTFFPVTGGRNRPETLYRRK